MKGKEMYAVFERNVLLDAMVHVSRVVEKKNVISILKNVLITIKNGKSLLVATDMDLEIREETVVVEGVDGEVTVPAQMLCDIVRKLPDGSQVSMKFDKNKNVLMVSSGKSKFNISTLPASEFPEFNVSSLNETNCAFDIESKDLSRVLDRTFDAISNDETRYYLNGVHLNFKEDGDLFLNVVATDGHRLSLARLDIPEKLNLKDCVSVIVPKKTVSELMKLLPKDQSESIRIEMTDQKIRFSMDGVTLVSNLIEGMFPPYEKVIPRGNSKRLTMIRRDVLESIDRVTVVATEKTRSLKMSVNKENVVFSVQNVEMGTAREEIEGKFEDESDLEIGFNYKYLRDCISNVDGDEVVFMMDSPSSPIVVMGSEDKEDLHVVMPIRG